MACLPMPPTQKREVIRYMSTPDALAHIPWLALLIGACTWKTVREEST